ncbi:hypothetical protein MYX84_15015 [Acidobacteria bacterium AH-259-O06]|nr:hypothetical protein [Acidobacteria bacterium AH-259-O06]
MASRTWSSSFGVQTMFKEVREQFQGLDILVNNVGIGVRLTEEDVQAVRAVWTQQAQEHADGGFAISKH